MKRDRRVFESIQQPRIQQHTISFCIFLFSLSFSSVRRHHSPPLIFLITVACFSSRPPLASSRCISLSRFGRVSPSPLPWSASLPPPRPRRPCATANTEKREVAAKNTLESTASCALLYANTTTAISPLRIVSLSPSRPPALYVFRLSSNVLYFLHLLAYFYF
jgi:hypothetical protein